MAEVGAQPADGVARHPTRSSLTDPLVLRWTGVLVLTRAALATIVVIALGGGELDPSRDLLYHFQLAELPFQHLLEPSLPQYPPLLGLFEAIPYRPLRMLGVLPPTALRLGAVFWEVVAGWFVLATVSVIDRARVPRAALIYACIPLTWIASAFFGQDELVGAAFVAAGLWCLAVDRRGMARVVGVAGLFAAKLLVAPFLVAMIVSAPRGRRRHEAVVIVGAIAAVALVLRLLTGSDGLTGQLDYRPEWITFSVTPWGWLVGKHLVSSHAAQVAGLALAGVAVGAVLVVALRRPASAASTVSPTKAAAVSPAAADGPAATVRVARLTAAQLLAALACLAVVNPEYVTLVAPALVVVVAVTGWRDVLWLAGVALIPWIADGFFAVIRRGPEQDWPVIGAFTIDRSHFHTLQDVQLGFAIATSLVFLGLAAALADRRPAGPMVPADAARPISVAVAQPSEDQPSGPLELRN